MAQNKELTIELLTYNQAAQHLKVSVSTLRNLVKRKEIPCIRLGPRVVRFNKSDLDAFAARCKS